MPLEFWLNLGTAVLLAVMLLVVHKYPPSKWVRAIVRDELSRIDRERAEQQRRSIEKDIADMKARGK